MSWTEERVKQLRAYWSAGLTCRQIANELGGVTRNAVIGKAHRLGLGPRSPAQKPKRFGNRRKGATSPRHPTRRNKQTGSTQVAPEEKFTVDVISQEFDQNRLTNGAVTLIELQDHQCKFPIGDPSTSEFRCCAADRVPGLPYCEHHAKRAFQPPKTRSRKVAGKASARQGKAPFVEPA